MKRMKHCTEIRRLSAALIGVVLSSSAYLAQSGEVSFSEGRKIEMPGQTDLEGPEAVDFDGDGKIDLLSGVYRGHLLFRKNVGTKENPAFDKPVILKSNGKDIKLTHW
jgi:hypothetical protein